MDQGPDGIEKQRPGVGCDKFRIHPSFSLGLTLDACKIRFDNQHMARTDPIDAHPSESPPRTRRTRRGDRADGEALLTLTKPIANWQAKLGWSCAMWGLIPILGLPLGLLGLILGLWGFRRVRRRPEDLGIRHAVGAMILGAIEMICNLAGLGCILKGLAELGQL